MPDDIIGPLYHPGAPHVRIKPADQPQDKTGQRASPYGGDFELWLRNGHWEQVSSSDVAAIAYDAAQQMLKFRFLDGTEWGYYPYTPDEARMLYITGSKGVFLWDYCLVRGKGNKGKTQRGAVQL